MPEKPSTTPPDNPNVFILPVVVLRSINAGQVEYAPELEKIIFPFYNLHFRISI